MFIDAVIIKGEAKNFSVQIMVKNEDETEFVPFDLSPYAVIFNILGAPQANGKVLYSHRITQDTDLNKEGQITDAEDGTFVFNVTAEESAALDLGAYPIEIKLVDIFDNTPFFTLTEGGDLGEFTKIRIVQV